VQQRKKYYSFVQQKKSNRKIVSRCKVQEKKKKNKTFMVSLFRPMDELVGVIQASFLKNE